MALIYLPAIFAHVQNQIIALRTFYTVMCSEISAFRRLDWYSPVLPLLFPPAPILFHCSWAVLILITNSNSSITAWRLREHYFVFCLLKEPLTRVQKKKKNQHVLRCGQRLLHWHQLLKYMQLFSYLIGAYGMGMVMFSCLILSDLVAQMKKSAK